MNTENNSDSLFAIAIHGGAGTILPENMTPELQKEYEAVLKLAVSAGYEILKNGGSSLDAVIETIKIMEDSPLFNAGKGAVFTNEGSNELDASIMLGETLEAGAIAGVSKIKNPIVLAKEVMQHSNHVLLSGKGAEEFAASRGIALIDPSYFFTEKRFNDLQRIKNSEKTELDHSGKTKDSKFGTVGCVALDKNGNLCAGTSTGGMTNKRWNRIGDSPIIGAGTYANNKTCAVSSTGWGEHYIRNVVAYDISAMMEYANKDLGSATEEVIHKKLKATGGEGGVIAIDRKANISFEFNTPGMYRASIDKKGNLYIGIFKK